MWEAVADEAELALLDVLLDGVEELLLGDLEFCGLALLQRHGEAGRARKARR